MLKLGIAPPFIEQGADPDGSLIFGVAGCNGCQLKTRLKELMTSIKTLGQRIPFVSGHDNQDQSAELQLGIGDLIEMYSLSTNLSPKMVPAARTNMMAFNWHSIMHWKCVYSDYYYSTSQQPVLYSYLLHIVVATENVKKQGNDGAPKMLSIIKLTSNCVL